jgi:hypothetical protein
MTNGVTHSKRTSLALRGVRIPVVLYPARVPMNADSACDSAQRWRPHQAGGRGAPPRARRLVRASGYRTCSHRWAVRRACPACGHHGAEALGDGRFKCRACRLPARVKRPLVEYFVLRLNHRTEDLFPLILRLLQETPVAAGDPG